MNRRLQLTLSPPVVAGGVALALLAGPLLTGALDAQPPSSPPPPLPVREQNLDANGFIKVHEQGIAQVSGTVAVSGGTVAVTNLPSALNVHPAPVVGALTYFFDVADNGGIHVESFPTINATAIAINTTDEVTVRFQSPLSSLNLFWFTGTGGELKNFVKTFTQPIPLNGVHVDCFNETFDCLVPISIIGSSQ